MPPWIYTVLGRRWFRGAKRNGGSDFSKPPYRQWYRKAHEILCPSAVFFFSPLWGQMFLNWFTTSINYKCYTNVRGVFDFDRKTGWIVTKLGHFKNFLRNGEKSGAAHAAPPIPYGYSIARICSIRDCFFCLRIVHTDKISSIPNNTRMNSPISKTGNW